jgi:methyl-accepting chemotaxis protein
VTRAVRRRNENVAGRVPTARRTAPATTNEISSNVGGVADTASTTTGVVGKVTAAAAEVAERAEELRRLVSRKK